MSKRSSIRMLGVVAAAAVAALLATSATAQERKVLRIGTSSVGSYGYKVGAAIVKQIEEALGGEYTVTIHPYRSPAAAMKDVMDGNAELAHTADIGMRDLYDGVKPYEGFTPKVSKLVHAWYSYPMETFMTVPTKSAGDYKCLRDFSGKPVFYSPAGYMNWLNWRRIFKVLGYQFNHVEIDSATNADALQSGTIVGSIAYTTAGRSLPAYWTETDLRTSVKLVSPCPDEIEKLKAASLDPIPVDPSKVFSKDTGVKEVLGVPSLFGYAVRPDIPEEAVYKLLTGLYKDKAKLVEADAGFIPLSQDFIGLQVKGISVNPDIPVHPGLAKFLKEHNAWNDKWKVANGNM